MTIYTWPLTQWKPISGSFRPRALSTLSTSPYTGASKAANAGELWVADLTWPGRDENEAHAMQAFISRCQGPVHPVRIPFWFKPRLRAFSPAGGAPWSDGATFGDGAGWAEPAWSLTVAVAAVAGIRAVTLTGFAVSQQVLWPGDVMSIGDNLIQVNNDVTSDSGGTAVVQFDPGLRNGVEAGTVVIYVNPTIIMRMDPDAEAVIERTARHSEPFSLRLVEAVDLP